MKEIFEKGQLLGKLIYQEDRPSGKNWTRRALFLCPKCFNEIECKTDDAKRLNTVQCKTCNIASKKKPRYELLGKVFGHLTVLEYLGTLTKFVGHKYWRCVCDCGQEVKYTTTQLVSGDKNSCPCRGKEKISKAVTKHGMSNTRIYRIYSHILSRCNNPNVPHYFRYGGKGIKVCERWEESFENFYEDMKEGYSDELSIDRIDGTKGYCKENCRWADAKLQARNRSSTLLDEEKVEFIRSSELNSKELGDMFSTSKGAIKCVRRNRTWNI